MKTAVRLRMVMLPVAMALLLTFLASLSVGVYALGRPGANLPLEKHQQLANPNSAVLTYKNDVAHSGANRNETALTLSNVNALQFGKRVAFPVDGQVYAQPLFMPNVTIGGAVHNVVFVATENDSVYAFDADSTDSAAAPLWKTSFLGGANNATTVPASSVGCNDINPVIGITSTPVIDPSTNTIYVVAFTKEGSSLVYRLHALDLTTGTDMASIVISGTVNGGGQGSSGGKIKFDPTHERQRANLLLNPVNGQIYMTFASFCDITPYHGWIMAYSFSNGTFAQTAIYNDTPDGGFGGIWGGAGTLTADTGGSIYVMTGNGTFQTNANDLGDSFIKFTPSLHVIDYFTPFNQACLEAADADLGSGGILLIPSRNEAFGVGKEGRIYVLNMVNMGHFTSPPSGFSCSNQSATNIDKVIQEFPPHTLGGVFSTPSTWSNGTTQYIYFGSAHQPLRAYILNGNGKLSLASQSGDSSTSFAAGNTVVSSNGNSNGIVWVLDPSNGLRAYDATNLGHELYTSGLNSTRDAPTGGVVKFSAPTVANGEVFVGTLTALNIYGLLPNTAGNNQNNVGITNDSNTAPGNFDGTGRSYSAQALQSVGVVAGQPVNIQGFSFQWPSAQPGTPDNWYAEGQTIAVNSNSGDTLLGILGAANFGASSGTATMNFTDGTSQTFTLGFTDWWGWKTPAFGNVVVATAPYHNSPGGKASIAVGVFLAQAVIPSGKILQSVVLPSNATGGQMHVFAFATQKVNTSSFNNVGVSDDAAPTGGNFDGKGRSYSAQALASVGIAPGNTLNIDGYAFQWPNVQPGQANNWLVHGQIVVMNPTSGNMLGILGAADFGASSGTATMNFTDGTSQTFTLGFTDWWGWKTPSFSNLVVSVAPYQNTASGKLTTPVGIFLAQVAIPNGKVLASVTLPSSTSGGQLHVFTLATRTSSSSDFNNVGVSNDSAPMLGNFDGQGRSYSAQALASAGVTAGGTVSTSGYAFQWPNCLPGTFNDWQAAGQTIPVTPVSGATTLGILGASAFGNASGTATMHFTDGNSQNFPLGFTDWWKWQTPVFGNGVVVTASYQNTASGKLATPVGVFLAEVSIPTGEVLASVTLPSSVSGGKMYVFALATKVATSSSNVPKGKSSFSGRVNFGSFARSGYIYVSRKQWV